MEEAAELLAPAGNMDSLRAAVSAGADAVYIGGDRFGARAYADNFDTRALCDAIDYVHLFGRRVYLTLNTLLKEAELEEVPSYVRPFYETGLDGVIVQDFGAASVLREHFPNLELHASTQMAVTGAEGAKLLREQGFCRVVPARELSLEEIRIIKERAGLEVETFIHGAMCYSYSGQCLFSSFLGGRSGNRGRCAGPCRLAYDVYDQDGKRVNRGSERYPLSLKDMGVLPILPRLLESGIDSFKIEGRMKSPAYVAGVTSIYRKYMDLYLQDRERFAVDPKDLRHLQSLYTRGGMETGYYERHHGRGMVTLGAGGYENAVSDFGREMEQRYVDARKTRPLRAEVRAHVGEPVSLTLTADPADAGEEPGACAVRAEVFSQGRVMEAQSRPMDEGDIRKQISRLGNTLFALESLSVEKDARIFIPNKELNELRRRGIEELERKLLAPYRRRCEKLGEGGGGSDAVIGGDRPGNGVQGLSVSVSVMTLGQYHAVAGFTESVPVSRLYLPYGLYAGLSGQEREGLSALRKQGMECYLSLPSILRESQKEGLRRLLDERGAKRLTDEVDGFLVNNLEALAWLRSLAGDEAFRDIGKLGLHADYGLYAFNTAAVTFLKGQGVCGVSAPLEWSRHELAAFRDKMPKERLELVAYGYLPLMETAGCIRSTMKRCSRGDANTVWYLEDRYQKRFPVVTDCAGCGNTILNSVPLSLHREWDTIRKDNDLLLRLRFTVESGAETEKRLEQMGLLLETGQMSDPPKEFTTGHFRKGVL